jgi:hypothetical protein
MRTKIIAVVAISLFGAFCTACHNAPVTRTESGVATKTYYDDGEVKITTTDGNEWILENRADIADGTMVTVYFNTHKTETLEDDTITKVIVVK